MAGPFYDPKKGTQDVVLSGDDYIINTLIYQGYDNPDIPDEGQLVFGGNSAGMNLTLTSTYDPDTKGNIYFGISDDEFRSVYDELNHKLGIRTIVPSGVIEGQVIEDKYFAAGEAGSVYMNVGVMTSGTFNKGDGIPETFTDLRISAFSIYGTQWKHDYAEGDDSDLATTNYGFDGKMFVDGAVPYKNIDGNFDLDIAVSRAETFPWGEGSEAYEPIAAAGMFNVSIANDFNATVYGEIAGAEFGLHLLAANAIFDGDAALIGIAVKPIEYSDGGTVNCNVYGLKIGNQGNASFGSTSSSYAMYIDNQTNNYDGDNPSYAIYANAGLNYFAGNVGIGTDAPAALLEITASGSESEGGPPVAGELNGHIILSATGTTLKNTMGIDATVDGESHAWIQPLGTDDLTPQNLALNPIGGNVGIGTTDPTDLLDVLGDIGIFNGNALKLYTTGSGGATDYNEINSGADDLTIAALQGDLIEEALDDILFKTYNGSAYTTKMIIDNDGNVGIGVYTSLDALLTLDGGGSLPPLELRANILVSPVPNTIENDGANFYYTDGGGTRQCFVAGNGGGTVSPSTGVITPGFHYGGNTVPMGDPADWITVVINGVTRNIPVY